MGSNRQAAFDRFVICPLQLKRRVVRRDEIKYQFPVGTRHSPLPRTLQLALLNTEYNQAFRCKGILTKCPGTRRRNQTLYLIEPSREFGAWYFTSSTHKGSEYRIVALPELALASLASLQSYRPNRLPFAIWPQGGKIRVTS